MGKVYDAPMWETDIYLIEPEDYVGGGEGGISNKPHIQLANRTEYLKERLDTLFQRAFVVTEEEIPDGGLFALPDNLAYIPGISQIYISWDGTECYLGQQFEEDSSGTSVKFLFAVPVGSEIEVTIINGAVKSEDDETDTTGESQLIRGKYFDDDASDTDYYDLTFVAE